MSETAVQDKVLIDFINQEEATEALRTYPDVVERATTLPSSYLYAKRSDLPLLRTEFRRFIELNQEQETYLLGEL